MEPLEAEDPRQVGRFEIVARLGAGGMGRVYLARLPDGQQFALKMIHQFLSDDVQFRRRFHREVLAAQRVTGENTAALVDADPDARPPWMAVEYVEGPTLSELIERGGPLKLASSVRLAAGMAQALISIHAAGLVHRDLKPSNVLMGTDGARLIDFGIAQASGASSLTMTGLVTGSAGFMSPEQAQAEHVTEASDVFALGTVLYFAATGRRPFGEGSMISVTYRVVHADPDLSLIRDPGLRELIANCLMKDAAARPTPSEIYERCPGIADGSWSFGSNGETTSTLAIGQAAADATLLQAAAGMNPAPRNTPHPPMVMPTRRDSRDLRDNRDNRDNRDVRDGRRPHGNRGFLDTLRGYASRPWLAIPVGAALVLGAGTAIALVMAPTDTGRPPSAGVTAETEAPIDAGLPTTALELPGGQPPPSIYESPTRPANTRPVATVTVSPTSKATATKPGATPTKTDTPVDPDPDPPSSSNPPVDPPDNPTPSVTETATDAASPSAAAD